MAKKYVYFFGAGKADGETGMKNLLGGKGANLAEMANVGLPVPAGFTITTEMCTIYYERKGKFPPELRQQVDKALARVEKIMGMKFGDPQNPLLVSCRSGARQSMPGMMETVLNIGLTTKTIPGLIAKTKNPRFVYDAYRRLIQMYSDVVMEKAAGIEPPEGKGVRHQLEGELQKLKNARGYNSDTDLTVDDLKELIATYKAKVRQVLGKPFPDDPQKQLWGGIRTPNPLNEATRPPDRAHAGLPSLEKAMPRVYKQLVAIRNKLEKHYRDMQDIEFTIQQGRLWMLQTRTGKRNGPAAVRMATDMHKERLITAEEAVLRVTPDQLDELLHPIVDPEAEKKATPIAKGLPAGPGGATGQVVFTADDAVAWAKKGRTVILVRAETNPEDVEGMRAAEAILTARGGMTSHAALVARGWGKCCVVGAGEIDVDAKARKFRVGRTTVKEGDVITLNGTKGLIYLGKLPMIVGSEENPYFVAFMKICDRVRRLGVRANADTPDDARRALEFGAQGIGLFRTEHMFYGKGAEEPLFKLRKMILSTTPKERKRAINELYRHVKADIKATLAAMDGKPVTIRLLDPPLHEFVPRRPEERKRLAKSLGITVRDIQDRATALHETNPMMGHRGVRLGVTYPEVSEMQIRAILEAAAELRKKGRKPLPEIMIPVTCDAREIAHQAEIVQRVHREVAKKHGQRKIPHLFGTMIEIPRAALLAGEIAQVADFFSFGTNDLTQMTFGFSRDDVGAFVPDYVRLGILRDDPFNVLDQKGVGELVKCGIERGRATKPGLKVGICGEHGGEPSSVKFCHKVGMDYVSCSPFRVPIARLAAAQAVAEERQQAKAAGKKRSKKSRRGR